MPPPLQLTVDEYHDPARWRWVLSDGQGRFVADHTVRLDPTTPHYRGFGDLRAFLDYHEPIHPPSAQLAELGRWIGEHVFGDLRDALRRQRAAPALAVRLVVPTSAQALLARPFELARFADDTLFAEAGIRFVYQLADQPAAPPAKEPAAAALRILAVFSLPVRANPLNLRRERYQLQQLVRQLVLNKGRAVELRVLQYGATRAALQGALEQAEGWDVVHLSGHGRQGELLLEDAAGGLDTIDAEALAELLAPARARLKLLILDACYSGVGTHAAARAQVGLDEATRAGEPGEQVDAAAPTVLPGLAQSLAAELDCAALAMRYPVDDTFATDLMLALYDKLLDKGRPLPAALHLALAEARAGAILSQPLAPATPMLAGPLAAELRLAPPARPAQGFALPTVGLSIAFPSEPPRFVGRLQPMLRASQALAAGSQYRGVLFSGMPGAGKTACALELAYRHEHERFAGYVWHRAPEAGSEISTALARLMQDIQTQLDAPGLGLTTALDEPERFKAYTLPRLRALLQEHALLLVLDNLESLLTEGGAWRDPLWGEVVGALLAHAGPSRVVLTSRRVPAGLAAHPHLLVEPIHALSFAESVLLARELPRLQGLFADAAGRALLLATLRVVQGHPKLLELADGLAADRAALGERVRAAGVELAARGELLDAFFARGDGREGETRQDDAAFVAALYGWTAAVAAGLSPAAALLFVALCAIEPDDRRGDVVAATWQRILTRLGAAHPAAADALAAPGQGLAAGLAALAAVGLIAVERPTLDAAQLARLAAYHARLVAQGGEAPVPDLAALRAMVEAQGTAYLIHPGVAEAARAGAAPGVLDAVDAELGAYHIAGFQQGMRTEMEGGGGQIVSSARRGAPYLLRQGSWAWASRMLEQLLHRDRSPDTLAFALPLLRRIAAATAGTERELSDAGVLANALWMAGRLDEAEALTRELITRSVDRGDYRLASAIAGDLHNLLRATGHLDEALAVAEEMAGYSRQAGLGPWTQLADEAQRLQVLAAMGRYAEVLARVEELRPLLASLPLTSAAEEAVSPWNVRETLLDTGREAATRSEHWATALELSAEIVKAQQDRGAPALELARTRFNDYGPLLRLGRHAEARELLLECRATFEAERHIEMLGKVYSALADLEDTTGDRESAVRFEQVALGYKYQAGDPESCAISHNNLANYLQRHGADPATALAHRLAAAVILLQSRSGQLPIALRNLARTALPPAPPGFAEVAAAVEQVAGVRLQALFARLPPTAPDGDAAIAAVWQLTLEAQQKGAEERRQHFAPILQRLAAAAADPTQRDALDQELAELEAKGWLLREPARRIWAGERDAEALTAGIDRNSAQLVRQLLELLEA